LAFFWSTIVHVPCGTLLKNSAEVKNITATIVDLSVKGYLAIEQKDDTICTCREIERRFSMCWRMAATRLAPLQLRPAEKPLFSPCANQSPWMDLQDSSLIA
jgi:hypothetical protein